MLFSRQSNALNARDCLWQALVADRDVLVADKPSAIVPVLMSVLMRCVGMPSATLRV
ncbi:hypothetical protein [Pseudomonas asturiensis]|uniref:hypothetical protein n=1 Tax=Pseudomonas asturiensis TaxID=1190415 RepID=UPI0015880050|nr:hypothetical protein [Pseudomonas asturiensis]